MPGNSRAFLLIARNLRFDRNLRFAFGGHLKNISRAPWAAI
jgi:hypothetical protein